MDRHTTSPAADETIFIESTRDRVEHGNSCLLRWGPREWYAPVADVRTTAEDLFTCAAYADMFGELFRVGIQGPQIAGLTTAMLKDRRPRFFGSTKTLFLLPAGSSASKTGLVLLARRDLFHKGKADSMLEPGEARKMGRAWMAAAEASESDTLFSTVLERAGWMQETEMDALFGLLSDIRGGRAEVPPPRL